MSKAPKGAMGSPYVGSNSIGQMMDDAYSRLYDNSFDGGKKKQAKAAANSQPVPAAPVSSPKPAAPTEPVVDQPEPAVFEQEFKDELIDIITKNKMSVVSVNDSIIVFKNKADGKQFIFKAL